MQGPVADSLTSCHHKSGRAQKALAPPCASRHSAEPLRRRQSLQAASKWVLVAILASCSFWTTSAANSSEALSDWQQGIGAERGVLMSNDVFQ